MSKYMTLLTLLLPIFSCSKAVRSNSGPEHGNTQSVTLAIPYGKTNILFFNNKRVEVTFNKPINSNDKVLYNYYIKSAGISGSGEITAQTTNMDGYAVNNISNNGLINGFNADEVRCIAIEKNEVILMLGPNVMVGLKE